MGADPGNAYDRAWFQKRCDHSWEGVVVKSRFELLHDPRRVVKDNASHDSRAAVHGTNADSNRLGLILPTLDQVLRVFDVWQRLTGGILHRDNVTFPLA